MLPGIGLALGMVAGLGVLAIISGARRRPEVPRTRSRAFARDRVLLTRLDPRDRVIAVVALVAGLAMYAGCRSAAAAVDPLG